VSKKGLNAVNRFGECGQRVWLVLWVWFVAVVFAPMAAYATFSNKINALRKTVEITSAEPLALLTR
jgi:hypothetical protein